MRVIENAVILTEEDIITLLSDMVLDTPGAVVVYQEKRVWPVVEKEISPFGSENHHVIIPVDIGKNFKTVFLLPVSDKRENKEYQKVIEGKVLLFDGADICTLLDSKNYEFPEHKIHFIFQEDQRPVKKKKIKRFGKRGYHVLVPKEIGTSFSNVFLVPGE